MLLYFKVKNSRSFADEAELSMIAPDDYEGDGVIVNEKYNIKLFKTAVIYGANASGKSNLLKALGDATMIIRNNRGISTKVDVSEEEQNNLQYFPNKNRNFDSDKPTIYTFCLLINDRVFEYTFSNNGERIIHEALSEQVSNNEVVHYSRFYLAEKGDKYESFSKDFLDVADVLQAITKSNTLLLSEAAHLSSGNDNTKFKIETAELVQSFFTHNLRFSINVKSPGTTNILIPLRFIETDNDMKKNVLRFLAECNIPIIDFEFEKLSSGETKVKSFHYAYNQTDEKVKIAYSFLDDESTGTIQFISWIVNWMITASKKSTYVIDEFGTSLHPLLSEYLLKIFQKFEAQLIFTSHDVKLMNSPLLNPEQIWLIKNDKHLNSILYRMSDFDIDPDKMRDNVYLDGLIDGIPQIYRNND